MRCASRCIVRSPPEASGRIIGGRGEATKYTRHPNRHVTGPSPDRGISPKGAGKARFLAEAPRGRVSGRGPVKQREIAGGSAGQRTRARRRRSGRSRSCCWSHDELLSGDRVMGLAAGAVAGPTPSKAARSRLSFPCSPARSCPCRSGSSQCRPTGRWQYWFELLNALPRHVPVPLQSVTGDATGPDDTTKRSTEIAPLASTSRRSGPAAAPRDRPR
jgi:hypothetical protein